MELPGFREGRIAPRRHGEHEEEGKKSFFATDLHGLNTD